MATVRIYKVAELLGASSQEVLQLLKQNHGIDLKSASSTLEEIVARQFVERLARQRGIELPKGDMFSDAAVRAAAKKHATASTGKKPGAPEPPKPAAPPLPPPRLIRTVRAPAAPASTDAVALAPAAVAEADAPTPTLERPAAPTVQPAVPPSAISRPPAVVEEPAPVAAGAPAFETEAPAAEPAPAALPAVKPPVPVERAPEVAPAVAAAAASAAPTAAAPVQEAALAEAPAALVAEPAPAPEVPAAPPSQPPPGPGPARPPQPARPQEPARPVPPPVAPPPAGRFVPPSIRLRVEEPGKAPPTAPPLQPKRPIAPPPPRVIPPPVKPVVPPSGAARPGMPRPPYPGARPGSATAAMLGGPRPLPSAPVRPNMPGARPGGGQYIARPGMPGRPPMRPMGPRPHGRREAPTPRPSAPAAPVALPPVTRTITLAEGMTVKDLADKLDVRVKDVLKVLLDRRLMMTINSVVDIDTAREIARNFGADIESRSFEQELLQVEAEAVNAGDLVTRAPVVTVMGHVDHGKTTLLDGIRETRVAEREAGGITQHIGAYLVPVGDKSGRSIVFLDTPGHEAFTLMRARGARVTDVVVLVVAADDGVMPQTREAIDHARAANVPIIVAVNKVDKPGANPETVKRQLADLNLVPEDWGGDTVYVEVSAKKRQNLNALLEMVLLVTEISELKANPKRAALGTVLESKLDRGRGPVATVLVQDGTLAVGENIIAGSIVGKVRALIDDRGRTLKTAGPSTPVEVLGLESLPSPGDVFQMVQDPVKARQIAAFRQTQAKEKALGAKGSRLTLESLQQQMAEEDVKELAVIIKADVQGSAEVLATSLQKLSDDKTRVKVIHSGVGAINESDVLLAAASDAIVIGFNVRPDRNAEAVADREKVDIRLHSVIYNVTDEIRKAMTGLLEPTFREARIGSAEVREVFRVPKVGSIAGCIVRDGRITRQGDAQARLSRGGSQVWQGKLASLKRFKDDVAEVRSGFECGIGLANFNDIQIGDLIEVFQMEKVAATA